MTDAGSTRIFDSGAVAYDRHLVPAFFDDWAAHVAGLLGPPRGTVLDLGCGTGVLAPHLAIYILIGIPLMSRYLFKEEVLATTDARVVKQSENPFQWSMYEEDAPGAGEGWLASVWWVALTYLKHLWFIVKTTVPLMLYCGVPLVTTVMRDRCFSCSVSVTVRLSML